MYISKRKDRAHQTVAKERLAGKTAFALLMGMRTGKTKVITDDWGAMVEAGSVKDLLVIAPGGVYLTWEEALLADLPEDLAARVKIFVWRSGRAAAAKTKRALQEFLQYAGPRVLLMNVEAISAVTKAQELCLAFLMHPEKAMIAIDESVIIKSTDSSCGQFCADVLANKARYRRILSGLISPHSPLDLFNQFKFLDPRILGYSNFVAFRSRYATVHQVCMLQNNVIMGRLKSVMKLDSRTKSQLDLIARMINPNLDPSTMPFAPLKQWLEVMADGMPRTKAIEVIQGLGGYIPTVPVISSYNNVEELHQLIAPHSYRIELKDCYDMPPSDYSFRDVELTAPQRKAYDEMRTRAYTELESGDYVSGENVVTRMLRLHQLLCGHTIDEQGQEHELPENRTATLIDLLQDYEGKAVIWCSYDHDVRKVSAALMKAFGAEAVSRFWGGNERTREAEEVRFKTAPECRFEIATPDAGGRGRDWSVADLCIYFSSRNNLDHRQQSEDRLKADGKTTPIAYVDLRVRGTVDEKIIAALRQKIDMATTINGDNYKEWLV